MGESLFNRSLRSAPIVQHTQARVRTQQAMATWEPHEDDLLKSAIERYRDSRGRPQWALIALEVPGRSYAMCRNRHARILAAPDPAAVDASGRPPNKCTACGYTKKKGHTCHAMRELDL